MSRQKVRNIPYRAAASKEVADILEQRGAAYEGAEDNGEIIADMWNIMFRDKLGEGKEFQAEDVWKAMIALKLCRDAADKKYDNPLDSAGYAVLWLATTMARLKESE